MSYKQTDTQKNLQRPICNISGRWVIIIIIMREALSVYWQFTHSELRLQDRVRAFLDWINRNGHQGQTSQGGHFVTGTCWVWSPCADCGYFIYCMCVCVCTRVTVIGQIKKSIKSVGGQKGFQWFCLWVQVWVQQGLAKPCGNNGIRCWQLPLPFQPPLHVLSLHSG